MKLYFPGAGCLGEFSTKLYLEVARSYCAVKVARCSPTSTCGVVVSVSAGLANRRQGTDMSADIAWKQECQHAANCTTNTQLLPLKRNGVQFWLPAREASTKRPTMPTLRCMPPRQIRMFASLLQRHGTTTTDGWTFAVSGMCIPNGHISECSFDSVAGLPDNQRFVLLLVKPRSKNGVSGTTTTTYGLCITLQDPQPNKGVVPLPLSDYQFSHFRRT